MTGRMAYWAALLTDATVFRVFIYLTSDMRRYL